jgi:hypothetical protein
MKFKIGASEIIAAGLVLALLGSLFFAGLLLLFGQIGGILLSVVNLDLVYVCVTIIIVAMTIAVIMRFGIWLLRSFNRAGVVEVHSNNAITYGNRPTTAVSFDGSAITVSSVERKVRKATWTPEDRALISNARKLPQPLIRH